MLFIDGLDAWANSWFGSLLYFIPTFFYYICTVCLMLVDIFQMIFRSLVGLETYAITGVAEGLGGDLFYQIFYQTFMNQEFTVISNAFFSICILAMLLLFITTIAAIVRREYTPDPDKKDNSKTNIIKNVIKAVATFFILPIAVYFGLYMGNVVLFAIDQATEVTNSAVITDASTSNIFKTDEKGNIKSYMVILWESQESEYTPLSGIANRAAMYSGNRMRTDENFFDLITKSEDVVGEDGNTYTSNFGFLDKYNNIEEAAEVIDDLFTINAQFKDGQNYYLNFTLTNSDGEIKKIDQSWTVKLFSNNDEIKDFDKYNLALVDYFYDLWHYNFIFAFVVIYIMVKFFFELTIGLMRRIIELLGLFFISPIVISFMPLDNSAGFGEWRAHFIAKVLSAYVTVFALNTFFLIYPVVLAFDLFGTMPIVGGFLNYIVEVLFMVAGLVSIKFLDQTFAKMLKIGKVESLSSMGKEVAGDTVGVLKTGTGMALGAGRFAAHTAGLLAAPINGAAKAGVSKLAQKGLGAYANSKERQVEGKATSANVKAADKTLNNDKTAIEAMQKTAEKDIVAEKQNTSNNAQNAYNKSKAELALMSKNDANYSDKKAQVEADKKTSQAALKSYQDYSSYESASTKDRKDSVYNSIRKDFEKDKNDKYASLVKDTDTTRYDYELNKVAPKLDERTEKRQKAANRARNWAGSINSRYKNNVKNSALKHAKEITQMFDKNNQNNLLNKTKKYFGWK